MKYFVLILICAAINSLDDTNEGYRKQYGLSFHKNCGNYFITFKCLTACKSMGFQVFRLDFKCKCTCHELKTTSVLPAFVWRTNGTTKKLPATFSPKLYAIVGTMSPQPKETIHADKEFDRNSTAAPCQSFNNTIFNNTLVNNTVVNNTLVTNTLVNNTLVNNTLVNNTMNVSSNDTKPNTTNITVPATALNSSTVAAQTGAPTNVTTKN